MFKLKKVTISGTSYPLKVNEDEIYKSTSYAKTLNHLKSELAKEKEVEFFEITGPEWIHEIYSSKGNLVYKTNDVITMAPFLGEDNPKFKRGDIVEVLVDDEIRLGFVTHEPPTTERVKSFGANVKFDGTDNAYLVDFSSNTDLHEHPYEYQIRSPRFSVSSEVRKQLIEDHNAVQEKLSNKNAS